ncbi:hypothetical protein XENOCAPTIV_027401 [Xenoophorus captivus]|uniref:Ig-like domain-containing protein n=1 Tax=Xenoophorus captivus TaxID=1517983 RepID=A0ABV0S2E2_9TELE
MASCVAVGFSKSDRTRGDNWTLYRLTITTIDWMDLKADQTQVSVGESAEGSLAWSGLETAAGFSAVDTGSFTCTVTGAVIGPPILQEGRTRLSEPLSAVTKADI